ncbi:hypothetical protein OH77DRAFT_1431488 [Trametes cingulata]|nr:hypothetical protein OH77DRAFT_1431488 [Trametes cingulata]
MESRPAEVAEWLRFGRKLDKNLHIADEASYAHLWVTWWTLLQPDWRKDEHGGLIRAGQGPWGWLDHPGKNGLFIALLSLMWWKEVADCTSAEWQEAVTDIGWVMWQMSTTAEGAQKRPIDTEEPVEKGKRPRLQ